MSNNSSGGGDDSQETSNHLALAAAILAAGAFVVALMQTLLEYIGSSEVRNKCTYSAIDVSAKQVKFGWSWRFWKLRVFYPLLDFSYKEILYLQLHSSMQAMDHHQSTMEDIRINHSWSWQTTEGKDRIQSNSVADPFVKMIKDKPQDIVSTKDLTWYEAIQVYYWKVRHPHYFVIPPRASWAQLLHAFGINDTSHITYRHADADLIPNSIDVPVQRVKLFDLGILSLLLGFESVNIDVRKRLFEAEGALGTITTIDHVDVGKILRFEGDIFAIHKQVSKGFSYMLGYCVGLATARISFGPDYVMRSYYYPLWLLPRALTEGWRADKFEKEFSEALISTMRVHEYCTGQIGAETTLFSRLSNQTEHAHPSWHDSGPAALVDPLRTKGLSRTSTGFTARSVALDEGMEGEKLDWVISKWQSETHQDIPTVLAVATFATLGPAIIGFPSKTIIEPLMPWIQHGATTFKKSKPSYVKISQRALSSFRMNTLQFVDASDPIYVGSSGPHAQYGWIFHEIKAVYDSCEVRLQDEFILRDERGNFTGEVSAPLFPETWELLNKFDPRSWAQSIEELLAYSPIKYKPANMLWSQVLLLDVAIRFLLHDGWPQRPEEQFVLWSKETIAAVTAIVRSWNPDRLGLGAKMQNAGTSGTIDALIEKVSSVKPDEIFATGSEDDSDSELSKSSQNQKRPWDLFSRLHQQQELMSNLHYTERAKKLQQLADLLELRAYFAIAFFILNPDSSDVLLAQSSEVEMPMI